MSGHKPGPWVLRSPENDSRALDVFAGSEKYATKLHHGFWGGEDTARLIAAAPELLAAAKAVLGSREDGTFGPDGQQGLKMLADAVAKAEGK